MTAGVVPSTAAAEPHDRVRHETVLRVVLVALAFSALFVGAWALLAPTGFYDDFPGAGHHWVSADGPFNEHLIRDVGGLQLALVVMTVAVAIRPERFFVRAVALATLVFAVPHFIYHATHLHPFETADKVAVVSSLGLGVVLAFVAIGLTFGAPQRT